MIDVNVWLGRWPFRAVGSDDPQVLVATLKRHGIEQAWVGSIDGLFHRDIESANRRLADACGTSPNALIGFGAVNPMLPDWEEDVRRCKEVHRFAGVRLAPAYHGYKLDDPAVPRLLDLLTKNSLIAQLLVCMEDDRTMHPVLRTPSLDLRPLVAVVRERPSLRVVLLGVPPQRSIVEIAELVATGDVAFDISMLEGVDRIAELVDRVGPDRILFGSHHPLFYIESASLKWKESELPEAVLEKVRSGNASRLIGGGGRQ